MSVESTRILWLPTGDVDSRHWDFESGTASGSNRNPSGVRVDPETALRSTVVLACVRVLATSVAGLPLHLYRRQADGGKSIAREHPLYRVLHMSPNGWQTSFEFREQLMLHLCLHGNAYVEIRAGSAGFASELLPLHPSRMKVERIENGRLRYKYREETGGETVYTQDQIMHVRWLSDDGVNGMVPVELARDAIGLARACEIHGASFFGNGARPGVVLTSENMIDAETARSLRDNWERVHRGSDRAFKTAVLTGGLKPVELGGNNQESQFLETRRFAVEEICRIYGCPPHLVGDLTRSSFSNIEQQSLDYLQNTLLGWLRRFESAFARDLLTDPNVFAEFDVRGLLRGDAAARASYYQTLWNLGVASINEIRGWENLDPVTGGDTRFIQLNMTTLERAVADPDPVATVAEEVPVEAVPADAPTVLGVLDQFRQGGITVLGAKALLQAAFPATPEVMIDAILAGVVVKEPEPVAPEPAVPAPEVVAASLPASRAMTVSIDFDRTFAADPVMWGEFARQSAATGNTVVMVSRRPDTPENQDEIAATMGDYREAFAQVLLVGERLKDEAAREAGLAVDVWVDDSPQYIRSVEHRAAPDAVDTGDFVSWGSGDGRGRGRITRVVRDGEINVPDSSFTIQGTEDDPAALIRVYRELADGWNATDTLVGHRFSTLTKIDPLESRALGDILEGDTVTWGDGLIGIVSHIMLTGTLNLGETEMEATPDDPAVLVSLITDGEVTNVQEAVKLAALTKVESNAYGYGKPKPTRKPRRRKGG
jgi:HK97 family phage portal protein